MNFLLNPQYVGKKINSIDLVQENLYDLYILKFSHLKSGHFYLLLSKLLGFYF